MSVLADIFVSTETAAASYDPTSDKFRERVQFKGLTPVEATTLWAIVQGVPWDAALLDGMPCVSPTPDDDSFVHQFPPAMVVALSGLDTAQLAELAVKWAATEELQLSRWTVDDAREVLDALARLARRAVTTGRNVYLWNCV